MSDSRPGGMVVFLKTSLAAPSGLGYDLTIGIRRLCSASIPAIYPQTATTEVQHLQ
ncbi:MAG TPA: hypothetical protein VN950_03645 [Terriglobales bacterium]|nr:hypothetical protein [Terriglobales bacterium]